jgi:hypothetical protein
MGIDMIYVCMWLVACGWWGFAFCLLVGVVAFLTAPVPFIARSPSFGNVLFRLFIVVLLPCSQSKGGGGVLVGGELAEVAEFPFSSALGVEEAAVGNCITARLQFAAL